jgi:hypothetical protein
MKRAAGHRASVVSFRDELRVLRSHGGISDQFADWHQRLIACASAIAVEIPSCANLCAELIAIDFEIPPEFAASFPDELSVHRITEAVSETFFRRRCDEADEMLNTLSIALRQTRD